MGDQPGLFALPEPTRRDKPLSAQVRRTMRQQALLADGTHPATGAPIITELTHPFSPTAPTGPAPLTCRSCCHAEVHEPGNKRVWKCRRHQLCLSFSEASDIRTSWPACTFYAVGPQRP